MSGIYIFSLLIFFSLFINGFKKNSSMSAWEDKRVVIIFSIILHVLFMSLYKGITYIGITNSIFNILTGYVIYRFSLSYMNEKKAVLCSAFYLLNPVLLVYACTWGKIYTPYFFTILIMIICLYTKRFFLGCIFFGASLLCSENSVFLYPLIVINTFNYLKISKNNKEKFKIASVSALILLFTIFMFIFKLKSKLSLYPYVSVNGFNMWSMLGKDWTSIYDRFYITSYLNIGIGIFVAILLFTVIINKKYSEFKNSVLIISLFFIASIYMFGITIHEEFFPPILIIFLLLFVVTRLKESYIMYITFSFVHFLNLVYTLSIYDSKNFNAQSSYIIITSFFLVGLFVYTVYYFSKNKKVFVLERIKSVENISEAKEGESTFEKCNIMPSIKKIKYTKTDYICILILTITFGILGLYNLGNKFAPNTEYKVDKSSNEILLNLGEVKEIDHLSVFLGRLHHRKVNISYFDAENNIWKEIYDAYDVVSVFDWNDITIEEETQFLRIKSLDDIGFFNEITVCNSDNNVLIPINSSEYPELFDEQNMHPKYNTYEFGTMFDEVYYARTAYEFINQITAYEITHPPLGKSIIAIGIKLFGLNPFGWRFMSVVFGTLMVPLMYVFSKRLFKNILIPCAVTFLLCFDFMHFTLSRICTIDIFIGFFILLMYYYMYKYLTLNFNDTKLKDTFVPLLLCGISTGLAISTKWTGFYAAFGLCILFFSGLYLRYSEYKNTVDIRIHKNFKGNVIKTILFCILSFVIIPISFYVLSYIPVVTSDNTSNLFLKVYNNMKYMLSYHSNITSTHPYSSSWYEWPLIKRPLLDAICSISDKTCSTVATLGNPLIWWSGALCVIYVSYCAIKEKDKKAIFLSVAYFAQLIPWMFVTRYTMIYHYLPCSLFMILIIGYTMERLTVKLSRNKARKIIFIYCICAFVIFVAYYPVISGYPISKNYINTYLELLGTWIFA